MKKKANKKRNDLVQLHQVPDITPVKQTQEEQLLSQDTKEIELKEGNKKNTPVQPRQKRAITKQRSKGQPLSKDAHREDKEIELEGDGAGTLVQALLIKAAATTKRDLVDNQIAKIKEISNKRSRSKGKGLGR